jgi:hypothetical protein
MSDGIIDLSAERGRRDAPDSEHIRRDDFGRPMYRFTCSYDMCDGRWCLDLWAYNREDADARMNAIRRSGRVDGQVLTSARLYSAPEVVFVLGVLSFGFFGIVANQVFGGA